MKNPYFKSKICTLAAVVLLAFAACSKDSNNAGGSGTGGSGAGGVSGGWVPVSKAQALNQTLPQVTQANSPHKSMIAQIAGYLKGP